MVEPGWEAEPVRPPSRWPEALEALRYRNFALFFVGALLSNSGTWMQSIAVPYVVYQLTGSAALVSIVSFVLVVPILVMGPLGGSLADRFDRRSLLLWSQSGQAVFAVALGLAWAAGMRSLAVVILLVVAGGLINGINIPAWQAFVSGFVPTPVLRNAVTLNSAQFNGAKALGPAVGGLVLWRFGAGAAFLINGVSFVTVLVALLLIRLPRRARRRSAAPESVRASFTAALRYARGRPGIMTCFVVVTALGGFGGPFMQLLPVFSNEVYGVGDWEYGLLQAAMGIGAVATLPLLVGPGARLTRRVIVSWGMAAYGVAVIVFGATTVYVVGLVALLVAGGGYLALAASLNTTIQLQVDEHMRGKVIAVYIMLLTASIPAGLLLQAAVVWIAGPRLTTVLFGAGFAAVWLWLEVRTHHLSHLDDESEANEEPEPLPA